MSAASVTASSSSSTAMKDRIITHMNADHAGSLSLYLQHYCNVPSVQSRPATLTDITTSHMTIKSPAGLNLIPFTPPMSSLSEARPRVVEMHHASLAGLGLSDTKINEFALPNQAWQWALTVFCIWCYPTLYRTDWVTPEVGGWSYFVWSIGGLAPWWANLTNMLGIYGWTFMTVAHIAESWYLATKLRKHQLPFGSQAWWLWIGNCMLTGAGAITRFDSLVEEKEAKTKKH